MSTEEPRPPASQANERAVVAVDDAALSRRLEHSRLQLAQAANALRAPLQAVARVEHTVRRVIPLLPYVVGAIAVASVLGSLLRGRRVRPAVLIGAGLDLWRLYKNYKATAAQGGGLSALGHLGRTQSSAATASRQPPHGGSKQ